MIDASPEHIWDVLRDVGAVHERLLPGRVSGTRLEGDQRFLTEHHHASFEVRPEGERAGG